MAIQIYDPATGTFGPEQPIEGSSATPPKKSFFKSFADKYMKLSDNLGQAGAGALKGVASTVTGLGTLGAKAGSLLPGKVGETFQAGANVGKEFMEGPLAAKTPAEKIGKGAEQIAEFFIPAGKVAQVEKLLAGGAKVATKAKLAPILGDTIAEGVSRLLSLGTKASIRAAEGGGVIAIQSGGDAGQTGIGAAVSAAFPVAGAVVKPVVKTAGKFIAGAGKRVAGSLSGRGTNVIDEIIKNPRTALQGLRGESLDILSKDAKKLKETAVNLKIQAGKEYERVLNNLQSIYENEGKSFDKGAEINKITDLLEEKFGITKAGKIAESTGEEVVDKGALDFNVTRFQKPNEQATIKNALNFMKSFRKPLSPRTMEGIASTIDKMRGSDSELNSVLHTITSSLRESVAKMGEEAGYKEGADIARNFAVAMDKLDDFTGKFKASPEDLRPREVGKKFEVSDQPVILTEVEKTQIMNDLQTIFSGAKEVDRDTLKKLVFGGQELVSRQAGRSMATATERASTKLGDFIREVIISPVLSPKSVGMIAAKLSLTIEKASRLVELLKRLDPSARGAVIEYVSRKSYQ